MANLFVKKGAIAGGIVGIIIFVIIAFSSTSSEISNEPVEEVAISEEPEENTGKEISVEFSEKVRYNLLYYR